jgi:hypothetical protein
MDSAVQLALMSKAKKVFGAHDTFLSFPVSPLPHTKRQLDFFAQDNADALRQSLQNLQAFSTLVNLIPDDEAWLPTETRFLWDVYDQVLKEAEFASSTRTPAEEAAYQQALAYLRVAGEGGAWEDSAPVKAYRQHKDAYLLAEQKYLAAKSTAESASDLAQQRRWREVGEPAQRAELDALKARWKIVGHRDEVETAQLHVVSLGARSPIQTWAEWNSRFNREIDTLTGASDNFTVFPSLFSPSNALEEGAWQPFQLSEHEIKTLLNEAPAELRSRLAADTMTSSVTSVNFEFSSAAILRPWFVSDVFRARFWRFADASRIISDGGTPPKGVCPAYVTAIVFARRVAVEQKRSEPRQGGAVPFDGFRFTVAVANQQRFTKAPPQVLVAAQTGHGQRSVNVTSPAMTVRPVPGMSPKAGNIRVANPQMMRAAAMNPAMVRPVTAQEASARSLRILTAAPVTRLPQAAVHAAASAAPSPSNSPSAAATPDDAIYILAFICKALPKTPDPDLALQW